jgi:hypothetical protein
MAMRSPENCAALSSSFVELCVQLLFLKSAFPLRQFVLFVVQSRALQTI